MESFIPFDYGAPLEKVIDTILDRFEELHTKISHKNDVLLSTLATGDRKIESAIKKSFTKEQEGYNALQHFIDRNYIIKEYSREQLPQKKAKQKLKKELRRYRIQHKVRFTLPFYRFWFRYIHPSMTMIEQGHKEQIKSFILHDLDNFVSFTFEELSNELLKERFPNFLHAGSYWDRKVEIDLLLEIADGRIVVGECKWKNSRICKKTLTSLQKKSHIAGFEPTYYALFSKSSFSNELLKNRSKEILLFDLEDFKEWSEEEIYKKREKKPYSFEF